MSAPGTPKASEAAVAAVQDALIAEGAGPGSSIHSWRCEHPDRYGPCNCMAEVARAAADAAAPHIAVQTLRDFAHNDVGNQTAGRMAEDLNDKADRIEAGQ